MSSVPTVEERIRYILGATGDLEGVLTAEEITDALALYPDWRLAAAFIADSLASRAIANPTSFTLTGTMSVAWSSQASLWRSRAADLRKEYQAEQDALASPHGLQVVGLRREMFEYEAAEYTRPRTRRWFD